MKKDKDSRSIHKNLTKKKTLIGILFLIFLFLRLFTDSGSTLLTADSLKYIISADRFPSHKLYNDQIYLLHPPGFPYVIHFFNFIFTEDYISVIAISLISSIITFFILYKLFMMVTKNFTTTFFVLLCYTLSVAFISSSTAVLKESFVVMLMVSTLYFFIRGIKYIEKKSVVYSTILGSILAFTSDHVIFIFPAIALSYIFFNSKKIEFKKLKFPNISLVILVIIVIFLSYSSWMLVKFTQYSSYDYYPNGVEGTPMSTDGLSVQGLISPHYFGDWSGPYILPGAISFIKKLVFQVGYMFNLEPFSVPLGLNLKTMSFLLFPIHIGYMFLIYLPLSLVALYGFISIIYESIKQKKIHNNSNLFMIVMFLVFFIPITQAFVSPRYIYVAYLFMFYFISYGLFLLILKKSEKKYSAFLKIIILLLLMLPFWVYSHENFLFAKDKSIAANNTGKYLNENIEKDAVIMAQPGYVVKIIYLTDRKTVGLYPKTENLIEVMKYYNVNYIVFGRHYTSEIHHYALDTIDFIKNSPEKFELIATIQEDYSDFYVENDPTRTDEVYIYKVKI
ncbi:glycosyltransferase family 39 protein [Candidatus Woesearchaeota archaeon]|nr:glycosyltransferase family 39 protein [Candidatus Woesearchaeota archaeon]